MEALDIDVHLPRGVPLPVDADTVRLAVEGVLRDEGVTEAEISVALLDDSSISDLNQHYLQHAGPTDVLAFALHPEGARPLGDVYVGYEQAERQAGEYGATLFEEILRLCVHGTLHVLGHDHPHGAERTQSPMYRRQEEILAGILARKRVEG
jgi:probable rRNA maturation factor